MTELQQAESAVQNIVHIRLSDAQQHGACISDKDTKLLAAVILNCSIAVIAALGLTEQVLNDD